jgi:hypothetical protein
MAQLMQSQSAMAPLIPSVIENSSRMVIDFP